MHIRLQKWLILIPIIDGCLSGLIISLSKINLTHIPAVLISFICASLAIGTLVPFVSWRDCKKIRLLHVPYFFILGLLGVYLSSFWYFKSIQHTTLINSALISALCPLFTLGITTILRQKLPRKKLVLAMLISFVGIYCIITQGHMPNIVKISYLGELYAFGAVITWVLYGVFISRLKTTFSSTFIALLANCTGLLFLLPSIISMQYSFGSIELYQWLTLFFIGILGRGISWSLYAYSIQHLGPNKTTLTVYGIKSISVFILTFFLLDDPITTWDITGAVAILTGLYVAL